MQTYARDADHRGVRLPTSPMIVSLPFTGTGAIDGKAGCDIGSISWLRSRSFGHSADLTGSVAFMPTVTTTPEAADDGSAIVGAGVAAI